MKTLAILLIRFYQYAISPLLGSHCRFTPTCSNYAKEAFEVLPWYRAFPKVLWRVLRCNPFCQGGHDPVQKEAGS